jgi:diguanylate cyclase (GGDEF)-like protein
MQRASVTTFVTRIGASLRVPADCVAAQHDIVRTRVTALAPVLAILTVAWSALDLLALPRDVLVPVIVERALIAAALLILARYGRRLPTPALLRLFLWVQALGFGLMQALFVPDAGTHLSVGYGLAPFVIAAQIALFPVTWAQALRLAVAPAVALSLGYLGGRVFIAADFWRDAWLVALLAGMAAWTSQAQLRLLIGLTAARHDATRDPLTGLANRRAAKARLDAEQARIERHGTPLSVLMLDLDRFKRVNDEWGHAAGDRVLRAAAEAMREELRACDLGARFGGEEFLVVLPDTPLDDAARVAERIRRRIGALPIDVDGGMLHVTVSVGVAQLHGSEAIDSMIARADDALYTAKSSGRDRVELAAVAEAAA